MTENQLKLLQQLALWHKCDRLEMGLANSKLLKKIDLGLAFHVNTETLRSFSNKYVTISSKTARRLQKEFCKRAKTARIPVPSTPSERGHRDRTFTTARLTITPRSPEAGA